MVAAGDGATAAAVVGDGAATGDEVPPPVTGDGALTGDGVRCRRRREPPTATEGDGTTGDGTEFGDGTIEDGVAPGDGVASTTEGDGAPTCWACEEEGDGVST